MTPQERWAAIDAEARQNAPPNGWSQWIGERVIGAIRAAETDVIERAAELANEHWDSQEPGTPGDYIRAMMQRT